MMKRKLQRKQHSASPRFAWSAFGLVLALLILPVRSLDESKQATTAADIHSSLIFRVSDASLDEQQRAKATATTTTTTRTPQLEVPQRLQRKRRHQLRVRQLKAHPPSSLSSSSSTHSEVFQKVFEERHLSQVYSRPAWWRPWWRLYRSHFHRRRLKKCISFNGIAPTNGSVCPKKNRPRAFGYFCMFGEQKCSYPLRGIFRGKIHPTTKCDCTEEGVWDCQDWDPQCAAKIVMPCNGLTSCLDCVSNGCGWSNGCLDDCALLADTPCYSGSDANAVCQQEQMDRQDGIECSRQTNCGDCVSTTLPSDDSMTCQWADFGNHKGGGGLCLSTCVLLCGSTVCPTTTEPPLSCEEQSTCLDCVTNGCGWHGGGACLDDCTLISDVPCYEGSNNFQSICQNYEDDLRDSEECSRETTCADCVVTPLPSDESRTCVWAENNVGPSAPGITIGGSNDGICQSAVGIAGGSTECLAVACHDRSTCFDCISNGCAWTGICFDDCNEIGEVTCYSGLNATAVCQNYEDDRRDSRECFRKDNCGDCVGTTLPSDDSHFCIWVEFPTFDDNGRTEGACSTICNSFLSPFCYGTRFFPGLTPAEVCQVREDDRTNEEACRSQSNCDDCISTTLPASDDPSETCQWVQRSNVCQPSCSDSFGCGTSTCSEPDRRLVKSQYLWAGLYG